MIVAGVRRRFALIRHQLISKEALKFLV